MDGSKNVEALDTRRYLLDRYGLRMTKRQVGFEAHKCRATLDNMRNAEHDSYCASLARAEIKRGRRASSGAPVLFSTPAIADWLDGNS